jgi:hypothetical protein
MRRPEIYLWWESREPSQTDDAGKFVRFVNGLPDFDPIYNSWLRSPMAGADVLRVPMSETGAKQFLTDNVMRYDIPDAPWPELGSAFRAGHAGPPPYDFRKSSYADTSCNIGAYGRQASATPNHVFMRLSNVRPSTGRPWRASELRPLMKFAREVWSPAEMCAIFWSKLDLPEISDSTWADGKRTLRPWIGWITYLPPDLAARAKYPADVEVETLADGAALVTLCEEWSEKLDAEGLARLRALEAALRPIQT